MKQSHIGLRTSTYQPHKQILSWSIGGDIYETPRYLGQQVAAKENIRYLIE